MKDKNFKEKFKNQSADYYNEDVYDFGSVYGIENSRQETSETTEYPVESWGWNNDPD